MDDLISRQAAVDALKKAYWDKDIQSAKNDPCIVDAMTDWAIRQVKALPSAQPEIIYCKDCKKQNRHYHESPYKDTVCPLTAWRGKAQGHEYDYQYCCFAERR